MHEGRRPNVRICLRMEYVGRGHNLPTIGFADPGEGRLVVLKWKYAVSARSSHRRFAFDPFRPAAVRRSCPD